MASKFDVNEDNDLGYIDNHINKIDYVSIKPFYNYRNRPKQVKFCSKNPSKVQESPLDAKSPQELLEKYGMYKDPSAYGKEAQKIYADLTQFDDYATSLNKLRDIKEKFMSLDVDVRARFNHNPDEFCQYLNSSDFNIERVMNEKQLKEFKSYKDEEKRKKAYEDYLNSDKYKQDMEEQAYRQAYEQSRYEEWKKTYNPSK